MKKQDKFLYGMATAGIILLFMGIIIDKPLDFFSILSSLLLTLGASIFFPIVVSWTYDRIRERWMGDEISRINNEFADGGILRFYKDRERSDSRDNAVSRLLQEFEDFDSEPPEIKIMGVSLRVFFNDAGTFYPAIKSLLKRRKGVVIIKTLVCDPQNPEVFHRDEIESKGNPQTVRDIESTKSGIQGIRNLYPEHLDCVTLRTYMQAPYCTMIIFPDKCYYSPNILSSTVPVRLPMIVFRHGSHGYNVLRESFDYIWSHAKSVE